MWIPPLEMPAAPDPLAARGRGLMLLYALCDEVQLDRTAGGTTVRLALPLSAESLA